MRTYNWHHINVAPDGKVKGSGAVGVTKEISMSSMNGGCGWSGCHCSDGHWICVSEGRNDEDATVSGITIKFDDKREMKNFIDHMLKDDRDISLLSSAGLTEAQISIFINDLPEAIIRQQEEEGDFIYDDE